MRAAALYRLVADVSFVAFLSTKAAWDATQVTSASTDKEAMDKLSATGVQKWNLTKMCKCKALQAAIKDLKGRVEVCNIFHSELLCHCALLNSGQEKAFAKVWAVKKPQRTRFLREDEIDELVRR